MGPFSSWEDRSERPTHDWSDVFVSRHTKRPITLVKVS